jgi:autotransporter-associated beta strand protein
VKSRAIHRAAALSLAVSAVTLLAPSARAQTAVNVSVNAASPITYANGAAVATMPATGLGLCSSVYANMWGDPNLPGDIAASGVQTVRYPGGSYSDIYNWSLNTANEGGYVGPHADMGNFFNVIDHAGTSAMVTVNYGSNSTNVMGAQPQEAAAEVAYANGDPSIYGTSKDVSLGVDAAGVNWYTAGYWAKLRASTASQYQTWATAAGSYMPASAFLAINHPAAEGIKYWEIGNEIGGNGYFGAQWEYDLHAPYNNGNTSDNTGRVGNAALSPTAYAQNLNQFATLMKQVDPTIKIGAGFDAHSAKESQDAAILQTAGNNIDFGIIHWYPTGSLPGMVTSTIPAEIANLRTDVQTYTNKGYNGMEIDVTEFGDGNSSPPTIENALFAADAYATGFENGLKNMNFQEMSSSHYLNGNTTVGNPAEVYYAIQMLGKYASTGDTFVSTSSNNSSLRIHADRKPDGSISLVFINDSTTSADTVTVNLSGASPLTTSGKLYLFGSTNIASTDTPPTTQTLTSLGSSFSVSIPLSTIGTLVIPALYLNWNNAGASGNGVTWDTTSQNWNNGSAPTTFLSNVNVNFTDTNNGHYAVTLNTTVTPNLVTVNNSTNNYSISGTGSIAGSGTLTKNGTGSLTLNTVNSYSGGTVVNAGTLIVGVTGALPNHAVTITNGTLRLAASTGLATISSLSITNNGTFDVGNNHVIINYGAGPDPIASIAAELVTGYAGGAWTGPGINSSAAAANSASYGLGYADFADTGNPAGLSSGQIEIKYALLGDANLDATVNGVDFGILAANFNKGVTRWDQADFNYDNAVNGVDFGYLAANFNRGASGASGASALSDPALVAFAEVNGLMADVPEPGSVGVLIAGTVLAAARCVRRSHRDRKCIK